MIIRYRFHPMGNYIFLGKIIVVTQRIFDPFEQKRKILISRSMARILTNKPLIESSDNVV